jgi:multicomponent K+:H+ antiporter subunit G
MTFVLEALVALLIVVGAVFTFIGSLGLAILPDMMRRLHAPTKATTLGIGALLMGSLVYFVGLKGEFTAHEALITLFLFITAPVSGMMIAKAFILREQGVRRELPPTGGDAGWATLDPGKPTPNRLPAPVEKS